MRRCMTSILIEIIQKRIARVASDVMTMNREDPLYEEGGALFEKTLN